MSANVAIALIVGMFFGGLIVLILFSAILIYSEHERHETLYSDDKDTIEEAKKNELP